MAKTSFSKAFDFVGSTKPTTVTIRDGRIFSFKNGVTISTDCDIDVDLCADYESVKLALAAARDDAAVTIENLKLSVNTEKADIYVGLREIEIPLPDVMLGMIGENFLTALNEMSQFLKKTKDNPALWYLLLNGGSIISSDGNSIFEWFHGEGMPTGFVVPKTFCDAMKKSKGKNLWGIGASDSTLTFHFEDGSWIKTESWLGEWLHHEALLPAPVNPQPMPQLSSALAGVKGFCGDGWAHLTPGRVSSDPGASSGASREVLGLELNGVYSIKALAFAAQHCNTWELDKSNNIAVYSDRIRGLIGAWVP